MVIVAVDPGLVTGVAWYDTETKQHATDELTYSQVLPWVQERAGLCVYEEVTVACEKYIMRPGPKSAQPEALMHMGAIEWMCRSYEIPLFWQSPANAKKRAPDTLLRQLGWYKKTKDGHANDAARHVLEWLANHASSTFAELAGI